MPSKLSFMSALLVGLLLLAIPAAQAAPPSPTTVPVTGSAINTAGQAVNFAGTLNINRFAIQNNQLVAVGTITGTVTNTITNATRSVLQTVAVPVTAATASCEILHLELGPLDLNLLGLTVHLNQIVLDISAV